MAGAYRGPRSAQHSWRKVVIAVSILAAAAVAGVSAWVTSVYGARHHRVLVASQTAPPWRTQWALSLGWSGELPGSLLTCRIVAHVSLSGGQIRFRLVNYPSTRPVTFSRLVAAVRTSGLSVDPVTQRQVTVRGSQSLTLAANAEAFTDPVKLAVLRGQDVTLSLAVGSGVSAPSHFWSPQTSGCTAPGAGDKAVALNGRIFSQASEDRWLSEVQVLPANPVPIVAVYGDSLSAGVLLPSDTGARWTDKLEEQTGGRLVALNYGLAGDRITGQAPAGRLPPRVSMDVLAAGGLSAVLIEMGSNDIKAGVSAKKILAHYRLASAAVSRAHATLIVATVPGRGDHPTAADERQRELLNRGLRAYPFVADIDAALTNPKTHRIRVRYDIGDHVHPNPAGVAVITRVMRAALARTPGALGAAAR